jgi:CotH kinase protein
VRSFNIPLFFVFLSIFGIGPAQGQPINLWETVVFNNDTWKYFVGTAEPDASSNLPIVVINTKPGEKIVDAPKITADMKIIYHGNGIRNFSSDSGNVYTGKIGIEIRGAYSASFPQKPYGLETRDNTGNKLNVSLLGMPSENDWVLLANYNDKTFLRNVLAFDIFNKMGNYSTRMRFCEVVLNNEYQGIYLLGEKIKRTAVG